MRWLSALWDFVCVWRMDRISARVQRLNAAYERWKARRPKKPEKRP